MLPHLGQRYRKARRDSAGKSRPTKLLPPSRFSMHGFWVRRMTTGAAALLPPRPPPPRRFLSASPLGWRSGRMGTREYGKIYNDFPGTAA